MTAPSTTDARVPDARVVALRVLERIDSEGAYANLALRHELDRSGLDERDRAFVTELVYGTTRLRRASTTWSTGSCCETRSPAVRAALRLGAYQLHELGTPPHAAVDATVEAVRARKARASSTPCSAGSPTRRWPTTPGRATPCGCRTRTGSSSASPPTSGTTRRSPRSRP